MAVLIGSNTPVYISTNSPTGEIHYLASFQFNHNNITMGRSNSHIILRAYKGASTSMLVGELRKNGSGYQVRAGTLTDNNLWAYTSWVNLTSGWQPIVVDWRAATSVGANNGTLSLTVGTGTPVSVTGLDNDTQKVDAVALGAVSGIDIGTRGTYYFDAFKIKEVAGKPLHNFV